MALSNSTLRRYTPPTCTLEVAAKTSALSRFVGKSVLKNLRFELRFDDPRKPDEQRLTIRGDAGELELLYEAVNSYVQNFLETDSTQLPLGSEIRSSPSRSLPNENSNFGTISLPASFVNPSEPITPPTIDQGSGNLDHSTPGSDFKLRLQNPRSLATDIYLEPKGLIAHNLFLGHLATEESGPSIRLSVTQLFDLATALDEYTTDAVALPKYGVLSGKKAPPTWAYTAAAVVAAVGVTATTMKLLDRPTTQEADIASTSAANQQLNSAPSPTTSAIPTPAASIALLPTPTVPSPLSTAPILPPPTSVKIPTTPSPLNMPLGNQNPTNTSQGSESTTIRVIPNDSKTTTSQSASPPVIRGSIANSGSRPSSSASGSTGSVAAKRSTPSPSPEKTPTTEKTPTRSKKPSSDIAIAPPLPNLPSLSTASSSTDQSIPSTSVRTTSEANQSESNTSDTDGQTSLFDTIPQVKEVRDYLQQRWKPTSDLTQILEYYVFLNSEGKVERIIPINKAAEENVTRTNIPRAGESFVSPVQGEGNPKIRVVFSPDGKVQTFYEGREGLN